MAGRSLLFLCASAGLMLGSAAAPLDAAPNPLESFRQMFEYPFRPATHAHLKYRPHKPVPVKATPDETPAASPGPGAILAPDVPDAVLPIPEARPADAPVAAMPPLPPSRPVGSETEAGVGQPSPAKPPARLAELTPPAQGLDEKPGTSFDALSALGIASIPIDPIEEGACTVLDPVSVASLESGAVPLSSKAILNDRMAETFAKWVHDDVVPAAHAILAGQLTGIRVAGSYACRGRDNVTGAKMSEHGFANAIDVAAFRVDKRWIEIGDKHATAGDASFLDTIRHAACKRFTTVLGPGEPDHDTHFHLDLERRGKTGKYTICE